MGSNLNDLHIAVVTSYPPSKGSLNEYGFYFVDALRKHSDVRRLSVIADAPSPREPFVDRVWEFNSPSNPVKIQKALRRLRPDAVIYNLQFASFGDRRVPAALGLLSPFLSRLSGLPTLTLLHNIFETVDLKKAGFGEKPWVEWITRRFGELFTRLLLQSDLVATTMPRYVDILRKKYKCEHVFLAPHGTLKPPLPVQALPEIPTVMAFGKFGTYKKVEVLLEAHKRLLEKNPQVRLVIAGSDSPNAIGYLAGVQARYKDLPNVTYTGYVAEEDVPKIFYDATVVAFPYNSTTGSSGVLHQAGEFGRAAVMPKLGDLADLVDEEGYKAVFFEPEDAESLADALWPLIAKPEEAYALGEWNHRVASGLLLSEVIDWYILHLQEVIRRKHARQ